MLLPIKIAIKGKNKISVDSGYVSKSTILVRGSGNDITVQGEVYKSEIKVVGDNCKVKICDCVKLYNSVITVHTNDANVTIGSGTTIGQANIVCMGVGNTISIGRDCMVAEGVEIWNTDAHDIVDAQSGELLNPSLPVVIGDDVWIGKNASVLKGVTIGNGAVIGFNSTITKDVDPFTVVVGVDKPVRFGVRWSHRWTRR